MKPFNGFIFLCGGPSDVRSVEPVSLRDALQRELAKNKALNDRVRVAEHYKNWANDSVYSDLVAFESHLAELSSVIVLVLESPGAIAELGLFSVLHEFQEKLLVFIDHEHYQVDSFIRLGPVQYLEKSFSNTAHCHRFLVDGKNFDPSAVKEVQEEMIEAITERIARRGSDQPFDKKRWLHKALLLCDILNIYSALTIREIRDHLRLLDIDLSEVDIRQVLYLLEQVELITMEPSGSQRFYVTLSSQDHLVHSVDRQRVDLDRVRMETLAMYKENDKKRFRAIQHVRKRVEQ